MKKYAFEKVVCPKCGKAYAVAKGSSAAFHCPGRNCHEMVNAKAKEVKRENVQ
jgi:tRNA(Ile2) C34 agmatinyltransferase TiaS